MDNTDKRIICCIASHIDSIERFLCFKELWQSIKSQLKYPSFILISVSNSPELEQDLNEFLQNLRSCFNIKIVRSKKQSQFQHYKQLLPELRKLPDTTWIIFSDDDDIWHKRRIMSYSKTLDLPPSTSPGFIQSYLHGKMEDGEIKCVTSNYVNYVDFLCRIKDVITFLERCSENVLSNRFCDVFFRRYIELLHGKNSMVVNSDSDNWMYMWRDSQTYQRNSDNQKLYPDNKLKNNMTSIKTFELIFPNHSEMTSTERNSMYKCLVSNMEELLEITFNNMELGSALYGINNEDGILMFFLRFIRGRSVTPLDNFVIKFIYQMIVRKKYSFFDFNQVLNGK